MANAKALKMHEADNVAVCTADVAPGDAVTVIDPEKRTVELASLSAISFGNKIALADFAAGDEVVKYGETIGKATRSIARGALVNHTNIASQPRAYADEYLLRRP